MPGYTWRENELEILRENIDKTTKELHELLPSRSVPAIGHKMWRIGLRRKVSFHRWLKKEEEIIEVNSDKLSYKEIATKLGLSYYVVQAKGYHLIGAKPTVYSEKFCSRCAKKFRPKKPSQLYCSEECRYRCRICDVKLTKENKVNYKERLCKACYGIMERQHVVHTYRDGKRIHYRNVNKHPLPNSCEICGNIWKRDKSHSYAWHHWDDQDPEKGIWICPKCHWLCNAYETVQKAKNRQKIEKYLMLKKGESTMEWDSRSEEFKALINVAPKSLREAEEICESIDKALWENPE